jgi:hypothetical protein
MHRRSIRHKIVIAREHPFGSAVACHRFATFASPQLAHAPSGPPLPHSSRHKTVRTDPVAQALVPVGDLLQEVAG